MTVKMQEKRKIILFGRHISYLLNFNLHLHCDITEKVVGLERSQILVNVGTFLLA